jgi:hypothetical protein
MNWKCRNSNSSCNIAQSAENSKLVWSGGLFGDPTPFPIRKEIMNKSSTLFTSLLLGGLIATIGVSLLIVNAQVGPQRDSVLVPVALGQISALGATRGSDMPQFPY